MEPAGPESLIVTRSARAGPSSSSMPRLSLRAAQGSTRPDTIAT